MAPQQAATQESHWAILAALRFFLAVVVVAGHFSLYVRYDPTQLVGAGYLNPLSAVFGFFVLSGYSIAASLDRGSSGFFRRRFIRIWPVYLAAIVFGLAAYLLIPTGFSWPLGNAFTAPKPGAMPVIASLLMLQTVIADPIATIGPSWSLAAEWWHYMIAPTLRKISSKILLVPMLASFILFLNANPPGPGVAGLAQLTHGQGIVVLSWVWMTGFIYYRHRRTPLGTLLLIGPSLFALTVNHSTGVPFFITAFVLITAEDMSISRRIQKVFNFLGDWSYPLYLFHFACFMVMLHFGSNRSIVTLSGAFVISLLVLYLVDYPSRKIFRSKKSRPVLSPQ